MVRLMLKIKADLENVTDLQPASDDFKYCFQVECTQCNTIHPKKISISRQDEYEVSGGRGGMANFVWKCGTCKREATAKFDPSSPTKPYSAENGQFEPFLILDCRNLEFIGFDPTLGTWKCVGTGSRTVFDVDLADEEWVDYDEKALLPVGVSNVKGEWSRA